MRKLAVLVPGFEEHLDKIRSLAPGWEIVKGSNENKAEWADAEVIFGDPSLNGVRDMTQLKWLQICWAGYDDYVENHALPAGFMLCNASGAYGVTIAEHGLGMLLALARRVPSYQARKNAHCWEDAGSEKLLYGGTAIVLGCGNLGSEMAVRLKAFGMKVLGVQRTPKADMAPFDERYALKDLDQILPLADAVIGCLPDNADTHKLLNEKRLNMMKEDAILVNVGRGGLIETEALVNCLNNGRFFGVGLDVANPEPLPASHPLWDVERVILTPHVAGTGFGHLKGVEELIWNIFLDNLPRYIKGEPLHNLVTHP